jgi:inositol 2-dehydrogenase
MHLVAHPFRGANAKGVYFARMKTSRLPVGLIGLGRLGRIYARDLATRIPCARLAAVADVDQAAAKDVAREFDVPRWYGDPADLLDDPDVAAVVIVSPTATHCSLTQAAARRGKAIFCEKPPAISLTEAVAMKTAVEQSGTFFQLGFMRRFDRGYATAKQRIEEGAIGEPVVFRATSRDPFRPSVEYAHPRSSGGLIIDQGIHDLDLARWFMGDVKRTHAIGGVLAYPELGEVGDIDNAIVTLEFVNGKLGVIDLTRNGVYGYDISTELLGTRGTLRVGYLRETPLLLMTKGAVTHDVVPYFMERFRDAYTIQLENFAQNVLHERPPPITVDDGVEVLRVAVAATRARETGQPVDVASVGAAPQREEASA